MRNKKQFDTDEQALKHLREKVRETEWNADIAREAIRIAERYRRKADNQRMMLNQLQKGGGSESIDKRVIQDALIERISGLNTEGEKSVNVARELIRFKRFVDGLTPSADRLTGWIPCSERLPNLNEDGTSDMVLLCWSDWQRTVGAYRGDRTFVGQAWPVARGCSVTVIAWMPLPPAYQGIKCDTCVHRYEDWDSPACDGCTVGDSNYEEE